jgi:hypothetical protein
MLALLPKSPTSCEPPLLVLVPLELPWLSARHFCSSKQFMHKFIEQPRHTSGGTSGQKPGGAGGGPPALLWVVYILGHVAWPFVHGFSHFAPHDVCDRNCIELSTRLPIRIGLTAHGTEMNSNFA